MPPLYKWFYVSEVFAAIAALAHLMQASTFLAQSNANTNTFQATSLGFTLIFYHIPLAIAITIGLVITWKYWGWLVTDRKR